MAVIHTIFRGRDKVKGTEGERFLYSLPPFSDLDPELRRGRGHGIPLPDAGGDRLPPTGARLPPVAQV